jgi:hypothetical protein
MGIGIILTAIVMGFALGGRKSTMSDAEIITRAKALGMVEAGQGVLADTKDKESSKNEEDAPASGEALDQEGEKVSEKDNEAVNETDQPLSDLAETAQESQVPGAEAAPSGENTQNSESGKTVKVIDTKLPEINETSVTSENDNESTAVSTIADNEPVNVSSEADGETASAGNQNDESVVKSEESAPETTAESDTSQNTTQNAQNTQNTQNTQSTQNTQNTESTLASAAQTTSETPKAQGKTVVIPGGSDSDRVAEILYNAGFVDSSVAFNRYLVDTGMDRKIRSGNKVIPDGATYEQIAAIITSG